ncbi:hypothetical protein ABLB69_14890 [Xenorhabdus khoisanae]|uniref:hypothetical protein n=1 Tax=Xenorhabdus khoisanae TaxID=880157 RepID=UPI0032B7D265
MKVIEFSEGFHVIEDVCFDKNRHGLRLTISSHGQMGLMKTSTGLIQAEQLMNILKRKLNMFKYRYIRLLFCNSADGNEHTDSFAAKFSRLLDRPRHVLVEAYKGMIDVYGMEYYKDFMDENGKILVSKWRNFPFESHLNTNYPIWEHVRKKKAEYGGEHNHNITSVENASSVFGYGMGAADSTMRMASFYKNAFEELDNVRMKRILKDDIDPDYLYKLRRDPRKSQYEQKLLMYYKNILETFCDTCEPIEIRDMFSIRVFFCNGEIVRKNEWMKKTD